MEGQDAKFQRSCAENSARDDAPQLEIEQVGRPRTRKAGSWTISWEVRNDTRETVELRDCHIPHGKFRGKSADLSGSSALAPGTKQQIQLEVAFAEPPGGRVENAFLILTVLCQAKAWRIFVRMTVASDSAGAPVVKTERITAQELGFSKGKP